MAKTPVVIPEPTLNREQRRKLIEKGARQIYKGYAPAYEVICDYVARAHFGIKGKYLVQSYDLPGSLDNQFNKVEKALHDEVGLAYALAVAKYIRSKLEGKERVSASV